MSARLEGIRPATTKRSSVGVEQRTLLPLRESMGETIGGGGETERRELLPAALVTLILGVNESNNCGVAAELLGVSLVESGQLLLLLLIKKGSWSRRRYCTAFTK